MRCATCNCWEKWTTAWVSNTPPQLVYARVKVHDVERHRAVETARMHLATVLAVVGVHDGMWKVLDGALFFDDEPSFFPPARWGLKEPLPDANPVRPEDDSSDCTSIWRIRHRPPFQIGIRHGKSEPTQRVSVLKLHGGSRRLYLRVARNLIKMADAFSHLRGGS
jgi:hypothetical protein